MTSHHNERAEEPQFYGDLPLPCLQLCTRTPTAKHFSHSFNAGVKVSLRQWSSQHPTEYTVFTKHGMDEIQSHMAAGKYTRCCVPNEKTMTKEMRRLSSAADKRSIKSHAPFLSPRCVYIHLLWRKQTALLPCAHWYQPAKITQEY